MGTMILQIPKGETLRRQRNAFATRAQLVWLGYWFIFTRMHRLLLIQGFLCSSGTFCGYQIHSKDGACRRYALCWSLLNGNLPWLVFCTARSYGTERLDKTFFYPYCTLLGCRLREWLIRHDGVPFEGMVTPSWLILSPTFWNKRPYRKKEVKFCTPGI